MRQKQVQCNFENTIKSISQITHAPTTVIQIRMQNVNAQVAPTRAAYSVSTAINTAALFVFFVSISAINQKFEDRVHK